MKKFFVIMVAVAALVAFAAPAFADEAPGPSFVVGGRMLTDVGYASESKELTNNGKDSVTTAFVSLAGHSYLNAKFTSADKTTGGFVELGLISDTNVHNAVGNTSVLLRYAYGWWKVGNCTLMAGQNDSWVGSLQFAPKQYFGIDEDGKLLMANWGYTYSGRAPMVRFEWEAGMFGFAIAAVQPASQSQSFYMYNATEKAYAATAFTSIPGVDAYVDVPRFDVAVMFKGGGLLIQPGFMISQLKLDGVASGADDTTTQYMAILPVKFTAGPFTFKGEFHYGQNNDIEMGGNLLGLGSLRNDIMSVPVIMTNGKVQDTHQTGGFVAAEFKITQALEATGGVGIEHLQNDGWTSKTGPAWASDNYTRKGAFVALPYEITKNFAIHPEVSYWDYGDKPQNNADAGNEWLMGIQFRFVF